MTFGFARKFISRLESFLPIDDHKYYYCDQPSSFSHTPAACGVQCSTERLVLCVVLSYSLCCALILCVMLSYSLCCALLFFVLCSLILCVVFSYSYCVVLSYSLCWALILCVMLS